MGTPFDEPDDSLPDTLFTAVERAVSGNYTNINVDVELVSTIARSTLLQSKLVETLKNNHNHPDIQEIVEKISVLYSTLIVVLAKEVRDDTKNVDLIDRSVFAIGASTTGSGIAMIISTGGLALGPLGLLLGGLVSLLSGAAGRTWLKGKANDKEFTADMMKVLVSRIKEIK